MRGLRLALEALRPVPPEPRADLHAAADAGDEVVDELALPLVVAQRVVHDLLRQGHGELADLVAQREQQLVAFGREPVAVGLEDLLGPTGRLAARLLDDLPALCLRLLAKPGALAAGLRERLLQLLLRGLQAGLGLLGVLELLADRLLALLDPAGDGRQDLLPDDPENEPEDDPLEDERAVGDE